MTFYHATRTRLRPGDLVVPGRPANFSDEPSGLVFFSDNLTSAEFWEEFLGGETAADKLGYWPDTFIYEVTLEGPYEPDPWCEYHDVEGGFQSEHPLRVVGQTAQTVG